MRSVSAFHARVARVFETVGARDCVEVVRSSRANERFEMMATVATTVTTTTARRTRTRRRRASVRAFDPSNARALRVLGAKENLLDLCERGGGDVREAIEEVSGMYDAEAEAPARSETLLGRWRLVYSEQGDGANPFQRLFADAAKNYQAFDAPSGVRNVVELGPVTVEAFARSETVSNARTNVVIDKVDVRWGERVLKTFELQPRPGAGSGWVEQRYLDNDVRISVGNKGSVFVHVRDEEGGSEGGSEVASSSSASAALAKRSED